MFSQIYPHENSQQKNWKIPSMVDFFPPSKIPAESPTKISSLVGGLVAILYFSNYWLSNHPNWRNQIFPRGGMAQPPTSKIIRRLRITWRRVAWTSNNFWSGMLPTVRLSEVKREDQVMGLKAMKVAGDLRSTCKKLWKIATRGNVQWSTCKKLWNILENHHC